MSQTRQILHYAWAYVLWIISVCFAVLTLNLGRETILMAMVVAGSNVSKTEQFYQSLRTGAVAQWTYLAIGLIAIALMVGLEHYYRNGVSARSVKKRFFLVTGIESAVLLVLHISFFVLQSNFRPMGWWNGMILVLEACLTGLFFWLWSKNRVAQPQEV